MRIRGAIGWALFFWLYTASFGVAGAGEYDVGLYRALQWRNIGPYRGGRATAVAGVAGQPLVYYHGATGGGAWKTEDAGLTWAPISDSTFKTGSVGAIAVAPSDPNVIYVGMGEACIRSNFSHGDGLYKSMDAGKSWTHLGLGDTRQIGRIRIHPRDPNLLYVAALGSPFGPSEERGVFRSNDGGGTWEKTLYLDDLTGAVDLALDPRNPRVVFASFWQVHRKPWGLFSGGEASGLFRSTDGGDTWTELTDGLPSGVKGRIGVSVSPVKRGRVWAIVEAKDGGVFRSDDGGESWIRVNGEDKVRERAWYYSHIYADTADPDTVYVLTLFLFKSIDGGKTFQPIFTRHADNHDLWIDPGDNQRMINANDGGANVTFNGGTSWSLQDNQPTAQFYHVITDNQFPYRVYGAQQDNSTVSIPSRTTGSGIERTDWYPVGGGESGYIAPRPDDSNIVYAGSYYGLLTRYDHRTRQTRNISVWPVTPGGRPAADVKYRFQWTFPIIASRHDPSVVYAAGNVLFKSTSEGQNWEAISPDLTRNDKSKQGPSGGPLTGENSSQNYYCTIFTVAESPLRADVLWTGSDDGLIHLTTDGGKNWQNVTPGQVPEWSRVNLVEASPHDEATAYLAVNRYELDDFKPYIYKTADYGKTWRALATGIPEGAFVRVVREDPKRRGLLYAGTETGIYVSFDDGDNWQSLQLNLPVVPITDLAVKEDDLVAATQGRAFWILDDLTPLHQLTEEVASSDLHLFVPRPAYRLSTGRGRAQPGTGENPPPGVVIHYTFKEGPEGPVALEILDGGGAVIKTFESGSDGGQEAVAVEAGMNRFVWNMRYPDGSPPPGETILFGGRVRGPQAVPGTYRVKLKLGGLSLSETFEIRKDPRIGTTQKDFEDQFDLLIRIRDKVSAAHEAASQILSSKEQLAAALSRTQTIPNDETIVSEAQQLEQKLDAVLSELIQLEIKRGNDVLSYPVGLNAKMASIGRVVASTDARPTDASYEAFDELSVALDVQLAKWRDVLQTDVPAFNELLHEKRVPAISIQGGR